jgi:hypothetical protein
MYDIRGDVKIAPSDASRVLAVLCKEHFATGLRFLKSASAD